MRLVSGVDNESCLTWLDRALEQAFKRRKPELYAYLEAVLGKRCWKRCCSRRGRNTPSTLAIKLTYDLC